MKYRLFSLMIIGVLVFTVDGFGQNTWVKTYGGGESDVCKSVSYALDSGIIITGFTKSNDKDFLGLNKGALDIFVMKIDMSGNIMWKKVFGGSSNDISNSLTTMTNGYILTGSFTSNDGDFSSLNIDEDDICVISLNVNGDILWNRVFGGSKPDYAKSITKTVDNGVVLTGAVESSDGDFPGPFRLGSDVFVIKLDSNGICEWKTVLLGSSTDPSFSDIGYSVTPTIDSGIVITGEFASNSDVFIDMNKGLYDIFVIKLDKYGNIAWKKSLGGSHWDNGYSIIETLDGGYTLVGSSYSDDLEMAGMNEGLFDICVFRLDRQGNIIWKKGIGGTKWDVGYSISNTSDSGVVLTGYTESIDRDFSDVVLAGWNIFLIKLDKNGDYLWKKTFGGSDSEVGYSIITLPNNEFVIGGSTSSNNQDFTGLHKGDRDIFVMKLDSNGNLNNTTSINEFNEQTSTLSVHPNPFNNSTTVSYKVNTPSNVRIELLNTLGQIIEVLREDYTDIGTYQLPLNVSTLSSGMYSVRMRSGSMNEVVPMWVVR